MSTRNQGPRPEAREAAAKGPRLLFFSGGSALRETCGALVQHTHNSAHLVTPFDSGGSSAPLRAAFEVFGVGDLRNRLLALADASVDGGAMCRLFAHRLSGDADGDLEQRFREFVEGRHELVRAIPDAVAAQVRDDLEFVFRQLPAEFDLRRASIGNMVLVGGFLRSNRNIDDVLSRYSTLLSVRGTVRPTVTANLHLAAVLKDGSRVVGQHRLTGKELPALRSPIERLELSQELDRFAPADPPPIAEEARELIHSAQLICFPVGSFYTSILAHLLPRGVGRTLREARAPTVYVPNTGADPEQLDLRVADAVEILGQKMRADLGSEPDPPRPIEFVLLDEDDSNYIGGVDRRRIEATGTRIVQRRLVTESSAPLLDPRRLSEALLSLV